MEGSTSKPEWPQRLAHDERELLDAVDPDTPAALTGLRSVDAPRLAAAIWSGDLDANAGTVTSCLRVLVRHRLVSAGQGAKTRRCQLGWGSAGSGRAGAGCRWYGSGCGSQSGDLVPDGESSGHFGAIVVSGEAMAAGPQVRRDHAEHRQEPLGCAGCAEAFHGAFALPSRLVRVLRPVEFSIGGGGWNLQHITARSAGDQRRM